MPIASEYSGLNSVSHRQRAIVIGGSFTGMLAARILSAHFEHVVVLESDKLNDRPEARKGQPQVIHSHGLLANGLTMLTRYFPGLTDALCDGGAVITDVGNAIRWYVAGGYRRQFQSGLLIALMSRPFLEWQIRRRVVGLTNVTVFDESKVAALLTTSDRRVVTGVRAYCLAEQNREVTLNGDLVVDTTGRGSAASRWLEGLGYSKPEEHAVRIGVGYTTRIYRRRSSDLVGARLVIAAPVPPHNRRFGLIAPMENDRWNILLAGWAGDHAPADEAGFLEFARGLSAPDIYNMIPHLEPLTDFKTYKFPSNLRRRYERLTRFPERFLVMGDAVCTFNPVYAQGMTSAALQAVVLDEILTGRKSLDRLWKPFFRRVNKVVNIPWRTALGQDFRFRETLGKKSPATDVINAYLGRLHRATHRDPVLYGTFLKVMHMMAPHTTLFRPRIVWRVLVGGVEAATKADVS